MKLSDIIATLQRVSQLAVQGGADAEVILKAVEGDVETVVHSIGVELTGDQAGSVVTINHGQAPPDPPEPAPSADPVPDLTPEPDA